MPPLTFWKGAGVRTNDYKFFDRIISETFRVGGTEFYIHKYLGVAPSTKPSTDPTLPTVTDVSTTSIQDVLNMENRDRKYEPDVYSLKGHYSISDTEFNLSQFGLFLSNDTIFVTFHLNDMVNSIGRTLMSCDVIEVLHRRDDLVVDQEDGISKFYVVDEGARPAEGYSPTWWPHMWRIKCQPITDSQEFNDILNKPAKDVNGDIVTDKNGKPTTLKDLISTYNQEMAITNAIVEAATNEVPFWGVLSSHLYVLSGDLDKPATIWSGDGIPPNHSKPVNSGRAFPDNPLVGDYFLRTDYMPAMLFRRDAGAVVGTGKWIRTEINYRESWYPANRLLTTFINNTAQATMSDKTVRPEQQNLRTAVTSKLDPDII